MSSSTGVRLRNSRGRTADAELGGIVRWLSWGSLVPVLGWVYGVALLWGDRRFTTRDKVIGSVLYPGGWFGALVTAWVIAQQSSGYCYEAVSGAVGARSAVTESGCAQLGLLPGWTGLPLTLVVLVAAALGPHYVRARGRSASN